MPASNLPGLLLNRAHPLARGLVGWWPLNEGGGIGAEDVSTYRNRGTVTGTATARVGGALGQALKLGGSGNYVSIPDADSLDMSDAFTLSIWCYATAAQTNCGLIYKGSLSSSQGTYALGFFTGATYTPTLRYNGGAHSMNANTALSVNKWYMVTGVHSASRSIRKIYINGGLDNSGAESSALTPDATGVYLGVYYSSAFAFAGSLAHARVYNRALSDAEVAQLYADPLAGAWSVGARRYYSVAFRAAWASRSNQIVGGGL